MSKNNHINTCYVPIVNTAYWAATTGPAEMYPHWPVGNNLQPKEEWDECGLEVDITALIIYWTAKFFWWTERFQYYGSQVPLAFTAVQSLSKTVIKLHWKWLRAKGRLYIYWSYSHTSSRQENAAAAKMIALSCTDMSCCSDLAELAFLY